MKRAMCVLCFAAIAVLLTTVYAQSQERADLFAPIGGAQPEGDAAPRAERSLLDGLEPTAAQSDRDLCKCVGESDSEVVPRIERALRDPLRGTGLDFADVPLEEIVTVLEEDYGIPIELDVPSLDDIGIGPDEPVTISLHGISLRSALRLMLKQLQLTYIIQDEVLMITTPEQAESELVICVYDVRDLVSGPKIAPDFDSLIDAILGCVDKETWSKNGGGTAEIRPLKPGFLVISQTQAVHEEVQGLIQTLHAVRGPAPARADDATEQSAAAAADGGKVVTRSYFLQLPPASDPREMLAQVRQLITKSLPDARWDRRLEDGQAVVLAVLPDRVIVRHTPEVQKEVEALLVDSGVANPAPTAGGQAFGEGGGFGGGGFGGGGYGGEGEGRGFFQPNPFDGD